MKIRGKIKKGKVVISKRTRAKRDHFEINLNSYSAGESTILSGRRPVHNMNFKRNSRKYLMKPERCSNLDTSLKAGFTFLMLTPSSMLILYREPAPKLWWREATRKTRKMLKLRQVFEGRFYFSHAGTFFNAHPMQGASTQVVVKRGNQKDQKDAQTQTRLWTPVLLFSCWHLLQCSSHYPVNMKPSLVCCLRVCFCSLGLHPMQYQLWVHTQNLIFLKRWNMENMLASVWELLHSAHIWGCTSRSVQFWAIE